MKLIVDIPFDSYQAIKAVTSDDIARKAIANGTMLGDFNIEALEEAIPRYNNYDNMPIWKLKELLYGTDKEENLNG